MSYPVTCPECQGEKEISTPVGMIECPVCEGKGKINVDEEDFIGEE